MAKEDDRFKKIEVSCVDGFQGREKDVVIMTTVRTKRLGFLEDERRLNVAVMRPRFGLVLVGNTKLLRKDRNWKSMIGHYKDEGCFVKVILPNYIALTVKRSFSFMMPFMKNHSVSSPSRRTMPTSLMRWPTVMNRTFIKHLSWKRQTLLLLQGK